MELREWESGEALEDLEEEKPWLDYKVWHFFKKKKYWLMCYFLLMQPSVSHIWLYIKITCCTFEVKFPEPILEPMDF